jgi:hypothetical protein
LKNILLLIREYNGSGRVSANRKGFISVARDGRTQPDRYSTNRKEFPMSQPVYKVFIVQGFTEAWYQLSKDEQDTIWSKMEEIAKKAGVKQILTCNSHWANEESVAWGVEEYPDMETVQKVTKEQEELGWYRYITAKSILGTRMGG